MQEKIPSITSGILHKTKPKTVRQEISENGRSISVIFEPEKATSIESLLKEPKEHIPRVFISYSHDSEEHKEWVAKLAQKLNSIGIWVLFDQWDTNLGSDLHHFMNSGIKNSDRILAICTEKYNDKSEENQGGAAYERMLMTPELFRNTASTKIIPVVRGAQEPKTPSYLTSRFYIDFTDDSQFESNWLKLGHILLSQESQRPAFGV
ncbi:toll/interleukin-1 receptor domain-containing protein [Corynebacterium sputi]|uniref:toll/interleukin-1 receptor domain-containing protein n=1 Tax=Corynebacterium sputi TaxID=489915 RepID=UPI0006880B25|nr:toll/interleukin-1 receptor domain-containing protein [Corynebacterium sputi]